MKKILVPCDFSRLAREAYKLAMNWAARSGGEVVVLYVIPIPPIADMGSGGNFYSEDFFSRMQEDARSEFKKLQEIPGLPVVPSRLEFGFGEILIAVKDFVEAQGIDLIIEGSAGSSGINEYLIGSNAEKIVRHSSVPVITVRKESAIDEMKDILLPTTLKMNQADFMHKVKELQAFLKARLHILLISTPANFLRDQDAQEAMKDFATHFQLQDYVFHFRNYFDVEDGIMEFVTHEKIDMVVMATHARKGLAHLINGSIAEDVVNHASSPIWTYHMSN
jgi:nucleotide-binding universal stress UspA family protein